MTMRTTPLPAIIDERTNFSCFGNFVTGTLFATVYDNGSQEFPVQVRLDTSRGEGSLDLTLTGNETIKKAFKGFIIIATISDWTVDETALSFHIKVVAKRTLSCTITERTVTGKRTLSQTA